MLAEWTSRLRGARRTWAGVAALLSLCAMIWFAGMHAIAALVTTEDWGQLFAEGLVLATLAWARLLQPLEKSGRKTASRKESAARGGRLPALWLPWAVASAITAFLLMPPLAWLNQRLDRSSVAWHKTKVLTTKPWKPVRRGIWSAEIDVADWNDRSGQRTIWVGRETERQVAAGTHAFEVATKPGALGAEWYCAYRAVPLATGRESDSSP